MVYVVVHHHAHGETFSAHATSEAASRRVAEIEAQWAAKGIEGEEVDLHPLEIKE